MTPTPSVTVANNGRDLRVQVGTVLVVTLAGTDTPAWGGSGRNIVVVHRLHPGSPENFCVIPKNGASLPGACCARTTPGEYSYYMGAEELRVYDLFEAHSSQQSASGGSVLDAL